MVHHFRFRFGIFYLMASVFYFGLFPDIKKHQPAISRLYLLLFFIFILFNLTYTNVNDNINAPANFKRSFTDVKVVIYHNVKTRHYKVIMVIKISLN